LKRALKLTGYILCCLVVWIFNFCLVAPIHALWLLGKIIGRIQ